MVVLLFGLVSLFADITYESMRSVLGPLIQVVGGGVAFAGIAGGLGELISYSLRPISGYLADKLRAHWIFTFIGYIIGLFSIPLMGFCSSAQCVFILSQTERFGKALRNPARDYLISTVSHKYGRSFAIHEAVDQVGSVLGPVLIAFLISNFGYSTALKSMFVPATISIILLFITRKFYSDYISRKYLGQYEILDEKISYNGNLKDGEKNNAFVGDDIFKLYILFVFLTTLGFLNFQIISFHLKSIGFSDFVIPVIFAGAMFVDSVTAIPFGLIFDRKPFLTLIFIPITGVLGTFSLVNPVFMFFWGAYMGLSESIVKSGLAKIRKSAGAFGTLYLFSGLASLIGSFIFSLLYERNSYSIILISFVFQFLSALVLLKLRKFFK